MTQSSLRSRLIITGIVLTINTPVNSNNDLKINADCIYAAPTTISLMDCYVELNIQEGVRLKTKLNKIYQEYPKLAPKIEQSYQHWLTYRESHCSLVYDAWGDGSARQYAYGKCKYEMARDWNNPMYINYK